MSHRTSTHITFSWKVVDGYHSSSNIEYFIIFYRERSGSTSFITLISYSDLHLTVTGSSFAFNATMSSYGQYLMWVRAYRPKRTPVYSFSKPIYVELSEYVCAYNAESTHVSIYRIIFHKIHALLWQSFFYSKLPLN